VAAIERAGRQLGQGVDQAGVDPFGEIATTGRRGQVGVSGRAEVVQPAEVGDPVARQRQCRTGLRIVQFFWLLDGLEDAVDSSEAEQQQQRREPARPVLGGVEYPVPLVPAAYHAVPEPVGGHAELDRHGGPVLRMRGCVGLEERSTVGEHVLHHGRIGDAGQEVGPQHPLVVPGHQLAGGAEQPPLRHTLLGQVVDNPVVEADERQMRLCDDEVLVIARIRDQWQPLLGLGLLAGRVDTHPGQVEPGPGDVHAGVARREPRGRGRAHLQPRGVGIEALVAGVARAATVERVQVQRR